MTKILFILLFVLLFLLFFYSKRNRRFAQKTTNIPTYIPFLKEQEFNPDISTDNWDLHKLRLDKFKRSQYKGLTNLKVQKIEFTIFLKKGIKFIANSKN